MKKLALLQDLSARTQQFIAEASRFKSLPLEALNSKPTSTSWSVLECLEHLNLYGDFYLDELKKRIDNAPQDLNDHDFKSGWFGEKTVTDMLPKDDKVKKMKTFKSKTPDASKLSKSTIDRFISQQQQMIALFEFAEKVNLSKVKTKLTLPMLRFKLGTTLRFVVYHNQRHIWQANRALNIVTD
ncbi:MAG: DinB family protein [Salibacteraceae bacterium]